MTRAFGFDTTLLFISWFLSLVIMPPNTGLLATLALTLTNSEVWWSLGLWPNSWIVSALSNHLAVRSLLTISFKSSALLIWINLSIRLSSMCSHYFSIGLQMSTVPQYLARPQSPLSYMQLLWWADAEIVLPKTSSWFDNQLKGPHWRNS